MSSIRPWYQRVATSLRLYEIFGAVFWAVTYVALIAIVLSSFTILPAAIWALVGAGAATLFGWSVSTAALVGGIFGLGLGVLSALGRAAR